MDFGVSLYWMRSQSAALFAAAAMLALRACVGLMKRKSRDAYRRGTLLVDRPVLRFHHGTGGLFGAPPVTLAGVAIAAADETKHFKLIGTTGTGKSTAIRELLGGAIARGDRAVFADPDGGYMARFFDRYRGDTVLNPFERDSVKWDLFAEIHDSYDVEQLASGLVPSHR